MYKLIYKTLNLGDCFLLTVGETNMLGGLLNARIEQFRVMQDLDKHTFLIKNLDTGKWGTESKTALRQVIVHD